MLQEESEEIGFQKAAFEEKEQKKHHEGIIRVVSGLESGRIVLVIELPQDEGNLDADEWRVSQWIEVIEK